MKKINFAIIFIAILLFIPVICNADVGIPMITPYKVRVNNPDGITMTKYNAIKKVPYDTILEVRYEIKGDGKLYGAVLQDNTEYLVDLSEVAVASEEMDVSTLIPNEDPITMYVYDEGAYLYKGPSKIYGKLDGDIMLPVGTTITFEYSDDMWGYVEYEGHKGWVYIYSMIDISPYEEGSCLVSMPYGLNKLYTLTDIHLTNSPKSTEENGIIIPAFTEVTYKYYYNAHSHRQSFCIEYNGKEGWYEDEDFTIAYNCKDRDLKLITVKEVPVYSDFRNSASTVLTTIPNNVECDVIYAVSDEHDTEKWCYLSYNGVEGWVECTYDNEGFCLDNNLYNLNIKEIQRYQLKVDKEILDEVDGNSTGIVIPKDTVIFQKYYYYKDSTSWYYVYNDVYEGWINYKYSDGKTIEAQKVIYENENIKEIKNEDTSNNESSLATVNENTSEAKEFMLFRVIVIRCIIYAVVIAIIATLIIKVINKKKEK